MIFIVLILMILSAAGSAAAQKRPVTIFLAGDSTMAPKQPDKRPETGWGEMLQQYFRKGSVVVDNRAMNGRSTKSFIAEGRWQAIVDALQKGDYVFVQFGHNDQSKDKGERFTPPDQFKANLVRFIEDTRGKGAYPVLFTPVMRRRFDKEGKFYDTHGEYPEYVRTVAQENKLPLVDMHRMSETVIVKYGIDGSKKLFLHLKPGENPNYPNGVEDNTHFSPLGAEEMAELAVKEIVENKIGLKKYLKEATAGKKVTP